MPKLFRVRLPKSDQHQLLGCVKPSLPPWIITLLSVLVAETPAHQLNACLVHGISSQRQNSSCLITMLSIMTKATWGGEGFFSLCSYIIVNHQRSRQEFEQSRNLEARADAEAMEKY